MKIRFEIDVPEIETEEDPEEYYWRNWSDGRIEEFLYDYAENLLQDKVTLVINQDDLKEFIKQVRANAKD